MFLYLETLSIFEFIRQKMRYFETRFLEEADAFMATLDFKSVKKILYNIDSAEQTNDPKLLKKLQNDIWEFRTQYAGLQFRLLAF